MAPDPHSNSSQHRMDADAYIGQFPAEIQSLKVKILPNGAAIPSIKKAESMEPSVLSAEVAEPNEQSEVIKPTEYQQGPEQVKPVDNITSWHPHQAVKLKIGDSGLAAAEPISVPGLLRETALNYPDKNALAVKENGQWQYITYSQYHQNVRTVAKAFIKLGLEKYAGVCILGFNSQEWFYSNLGAIFAGGLAAGVYTTNSPEACAHCAIDCKAQICVVEDAKQLDKILKIKSSLPQLKAIIQYKGTPTQSGVLSWKDVMDMGANETDHKLEERLKQISINECCSLIYTSGTTGPPKGVMLSHDNITWTSHATMLHLGLVTGVESLISYLPLSHVAAQLADMYIPIKAVATIFFAQPDALKGSLGITLKEAKPTVFLGVPRVWEKMYEKMMEVGRKTTGIKKGISTWAKSVGLQASEYRQCNDPTRPFGYKIAKSVVFSKVKAALGFEKTRVFISAAAPISMDIVKYFHSLDIPLTEVYGMSECSAPHTAGHPNLYKWGTAGATMKGCTTKIHSPDAEGNGEICMGGRNVCMGYMNMQTKTTETIDDDGYLHSGDIGKLDEDGYLFITGRIKELIITAGGENIPPILIEDELKKNLPCLSNAMLIGDKRKFLSILLTLKTDMTEEGFPKDTLAQGCLDWCKSIGSNAKTIQDIITQTDEKVMAAIQNGINQTNKVSTSNAQKIQKWTILPIDFSVPGEELGPTLKLKRSFVSEKYQKTIEEFYQ